MTALKVTLTLSVMDSLPEAVKATMNFLVDNDNYAIHKQIQSHLDDTNYIYNESTSEQFN